MLGMMDTAQMSSRKNWIWAGAGGDGIWCGGGRDLVRGGRPLEHINSDRKLAFAPQGAIWAYRCVHRSKV